MFGAFSFKVISFVTGPSIQNELEHRSHFCRLFALWNTAYMIRRGLGRIKNSFGAIRWHYLQHFRYHQRGPRFKLNTAYMHIYAIYSECPFLLSDKHWHLPINSVFLRWFRKWNTTRLKWFTCLVCSSVVCGGELGVGGVRHTFEYRSYENKNWVPWCLRVRALTIGVCCLAYSSYNIFSVLR